MEQQTVHAMTFLPDDQAARTAAFEELFQQNWEQVYQVLFRLTGDRAEAEDLALETFWRLWQDPPRQNGPLGGWLYRVATRLGYNALRSARRRLQYELHAGKNALDQSAPLVPADESERSAQRRRIRLVLAKWTPARPRPSSCARPDFRTRKSPPPWMLNPLQWAACCCGRRRSL
jgi:RNA polymerase sigma factor (sigma-70 family)